MGKENIELDFKIDKLTNSIENSVSGEIFGTTVSLLDLKDCKQLNKTDWLFDWKLECKTKGNQVFKLTTINNPAIIQGLISITDKGDHVFMNLIENAKFNKGKKKLYLGVAGNLVAYACKLSFEKGYEGIISFVAKTQLIKHYEQTIGAKCFMGNRMYIDTKESFVLTKKYFNDFKL